jgi:hypothetical protein
MTITRENLVSALEANGVHIDSRHDAPHYVLIWIKSDFYYLKISEYNVRFDGFYYTNVAALMDAIVPKMFV